MCSVGRHERGLCPRFNRGRVPHGSDVRDSPIGGLTSGDERARGNRPRPSHAHARDDDIGLGPRRVDLVEELVDDCHRRRRMTITNRQASNAETSCGRVLDEGQVAPPFKLAILDQQDEQISSQPAQALEVRPRIAAVDEAGIPNRRTPLAGQDRQPRAARQPIAEQVWSTQSRGIGGSTAVSTTRCYRAVRVEWPMSRRPRTQAVPQATRSRTPPRRPGRSSPA